MHAVAVLREAGIQRVYEAEDGLAGLAAVRNLFPPPALLVVDLEMPKMDGIEMLQALATDNYRPPRSGCQRDTCFTGSLGGNHVPGTGASYSWCF